MKTKIKFLLVTCVIAAVAITSISFTQNGSNIDVSLADIAVMAKADGESGSGDDCWWEHTRGGDETHVICQVWVGPVSYFCKTVIDCSWVDALGTCI